MKPPFAQTCAGTAVKRSTGKIRVHASAFFLQFVSFCTWLWNCAKNVEWRNPNLLLTLIWSLLAYFERATQSESTEGTLEADQKGDEKGANQEGPQQGADADVSSKGTPVAGLETTAQSSTPESDHIELDELESEPRLKKLREHFTGLASITAEVDVETAQIEDTAGAFEEPASTSESDHTELEELVYQPQLKESTQGDASTTSSAGTEAAGEADPVRPPSKPKEPTRTTTTKSRRQPRVLPALPDPALLFGPKLHRQPNPSAPKALPASASTNPSPSAQPQLRSPEPIPVEPSSRRSVHLQTLRGMSESAVIAAKKTHPIRRTLRRTASTEVLEKHSSRSLCGVCEELTQFLCSCRGEGVSPVEWGGEVVEVEVGRELWKRS